MNLSNLKTQMPILQQKEKSQDATEFKFEQIMGGVSFCPQKWKLHL